MSLRTADDIFNIEDDKDHTDGSEEESEHKTTNTSTYIKGSKKIQYKKRNTVMFGLDGNSDGEESDESGDDQDTFSGDGEEHGSNNLEQGKPGTTVDSRFATMDDDDDENTKTPRVRGTKKSKKVKPLTPEALEKFQAVRDKTGIVYLSKIPPFMKPVKIRHLLTKFGEVGRVYLAPEDPKIAARRKKYGGNKKQNYTEGWIEFLDKSVAKQVAKALNATTIGGKKNSHYHDDMWNIKYLPKFKWDHLTERIAYENASRAQRLQAEISQAKRENKFILNNIEKSKMIRSIEEKKSTKRKTGEDQSVNGEAAASDTNEAKVRRAFKQRRLGNNVESNSETPAVVQGKIKSVLGNVFGR